MSFCRNSIAYFSETDRNSATVTRGEKADPYSKSSWNTAYELEESLSIFLVFRVTSDRFHWTEEGRSARENRPENRDEPGRGVHQFDRAKCALENCRFWFPPNCNEDGEGTLYFFLGVRVRVWVCGYQSLWVKMDVSGSDARTFVTNIWG